MGPRESWTEILTMAHCSPYGWTFWTGQDTRDHPTEHGLAQPHDGCKGMFVYHVLYANMLSQ